MRKTISGLVAAVAVVVASAAPAMACGGGGLFQSSCSPCQAYASPCAQSYDYSGYGAGYGGVSSYERLPDPTQYYYVNQGPTFTGSGNYAPIQTYQESAVSGWGAYNRPYYYGYDGGRYANATTHYYDGATAQGPAIYSYRTRSHFRPWRARHSYYGYAPQRSYYHARPSYRYGYAPQRSYAPRYSYHRNYRYAAPRVVYGSRHFGYGHRYQRPLRRYY